LAFMNDPDSVGRAHIYDGDSIRDGRYDVWSTVGRGTFGTVVAAYDNKRKHDVALKIIRDVERYRRSAYVECKILDQLMDHLAHRNSCIVEFYGNFSTSIRNQRHVCISFECLGRSVYSFLKANRYRGFQLEGVRDIIFQVMHAVGFCHSIGLTHTDLKLENVLFVDDGYTKVKAQEWEDYRIPNYYAVKLIDFGNATYATDYHSRIINTRQYRAPEVLLGVGWDHQSDVWSIGCIIAELWTGNLLFQTHENIEHLALMEQILERKIPASMIDRVKSQVQAGTQPRARKRKKHTVQTRTRRSPSEQDVEFFLDVDKFEIKWPENASSQESIDHVRKQQSLKNRLVKQELKNKLMSAQEELFDLCSKCLTYDPAERVTAKNALKHTFLNSAELRERYLRKGIDVLSDD